MDLFGYQISKKVASKEPELVSPIPKTTADGGTTVTVGGGYYGQYVDLAGTEAISDHDLIMKYREAAQQPECDAAINDIVDGALHRLTNHRR
jgi:hypothetical protein